VSAARGLLSPPDAAVKRGARFLRRRAAWRSGPQRLIARHAGIEQRAPLILAHLFDRALADVGTPRSYIMQAAELGETVRLNGETWHWFTAGGTADGRGLYELAAWRWDVPVYDAAMALWHIVKERAA
jgi:hypothetical protein